MKNTKSSNPGAVTHRLIQLLVLMVVAAWSTELTAKPKQKYVVGCGQDMMHIVNHGGVHNYVKFLPQLKATGLDGITVSIPGLDVDTRRFEFADLEQYRADIAMVARELPYSQLRVGLTMKKRFSWDDDAGWEMVAHNMGVCARFAKETGLKGIAYDEEDYCATKQFFFLESDGEYPIAALKARRRGAQVFAEVFREFPDIIFRCSWLMSTVQKWHAWAVPERGDNLSACKRSYGELWIDFMNGSLDVIPPNAKIGEGSEERGYHGLFEKNEFPIAAWRAARGSVELIAPENRKKFLSQLTVSFGQYPDEYINSDTKENRDYIIGPYAGSRLNHFRFNLAQALNCADDFVWIYGEKGTWIDWQQDLSKPPRVETEGCFYYKTWEAQMPGFYRMIKIAKGDYSPLEEEIRDGRMIASTNAVTTWTSDKEPEPNRFVRENGILRLNGNGCFVTSIKVKPGDDVYIKCEARGMCPRIGVAFYENGKHEPAKHGRPIKMAPDEDWHRGEWVELVQHVLVPEGVDCVQVTPSGPATHEYPNEFRNLRVYHSQ